MTIESFENRDAANPMAVAKAVTRWIESPRSDEDDICLEAILLEEGVISPDDAASFEFDEQPYGVGIILSIEDDDQLYRISGYTGMTSAWGE